MVGVTSSDTQPLRPHPTMHDLILLKLLYTLVININPGNNTLWIIAIQHFQGMEGVPQRLTLYTTGDLAHVTPAVFDAAMQSCNVVFKCQVWQKP